MTVTLQEAQAALPALIAGLSPGQELVIEQGGKPVATLTAAPPSAGPWPSQAGCYPKAEFWMAPDFDAPLDAFGAVPPAPGHPA